MLATCRVLLTAGHGHRQPIGNGMLALLRHPEERAALAADPARLPTAVEELLRYDSPVQMTMRFAMEDTELARQSIPKGSLVVTLLGAANRDSAQFPDPDRLDIKRDNAHSHLAFGAGVHYCLGAALARLEGEIAIGALLRRFPGLAIGPEGALHRAHLVLRGLTALPVTFWHALSVLPGSCPLSAPFPDFGKGEASREQRFFPFPEIGGKGAGG
jgi:cytochrome P450